MCLYPDGNGFDLKQALSKRFGLGMNQITLGNGSNDVLPGFERIRDTIAQTPAGRAL